MSPSVRRRGPLPARIYWTRRLVFLGVPLLLVVVIAQVLGGSSDDTGEEQARVVSSEVTGAQTPAPSEDEADPEDSPAPGAKGKKRKKVAPAPVLAEPTGDCTDSDIVATPDLKKAPGGSKVPITVNLRTREAEACTWEVSPETFTVTITSGSDHIWSSRECPASIPTQEVVVRRVVDAPVEVTWHARRSDATCSRFTDWAMPGYYHVKVAALGGEPTDVQFRLVAPEAPVVIKTVEPKPEPKKDKKDKKKRKDRPRDFQPGQDGEGNPNG
jgi:hypothetical protein